MIEKSAAELEREAEATRARVVATAGSIRNKMTPAQLFGEFAGLFRDGAASDMLHNLKVQVRENPLPLTVIGAGLAWLMLGSGAPAASAGTDGATQRGPSLDGAFGAGMGSTVSDAAGSVAQAASERPELSREWQARRPARCRTWQAAQRIHWRVRRQLQPMWRRMPAAPHIV